MTAPRPDRSRPRPRLLGLATAVPRHELRQDEVADKAGELFGGDFVNFDRLRPVYTNAAIETRRSCVPIDWYLAPHDFRERNDLYLANALDLIEQAAGAALARAGLAFGDIDAIVTVSSSGIATPSLDARLMQRVDLRPDVQRLPIFGLGCAGGVMGLGRAAALARADPGARILLLVVELCGLTFRHHDRSKSNVVATALFGDGAGAAVIACEGDGPVLSAWGEHTWPDTLDVMGWAVADDGLTVIFARDIPSLVRTSIRPALEAYLALSDLGLRDVDHWLFHPGGAKVLDALDDCLALLPGALGPSRQVLRERGNMSAATILFVLAQAQADAGGTLPGRALLASLGPGFSAGFATLEPA